MYKTLICADPSQEKTIKDVDKYLSSLPQDADAILPNIISLTSNLISFLFDNLVCHILIQLRLVSFFLICFGLVLFA
jgi:hypothetical protein